MMDLMEVQIEDLLARLRKGPLRDRERAACSLARLGSRAVPKLLTALQDPDWSIRRLAAVAFIMAPDARAVPLLCEASAESDWEVRWAAVAALKAAADHRSVSALAPRLADVHPKIRALAAEALVNINARASITPEQLPGSALRFVQANSWLQDSDFRVRQAAVLLLGVLDDSRVLPVLVERLASDEPLVAAEAARALGRIGCKQALPPLLQVFRENLDSRVQGAACGALGRIGNHRAITGLDLALRSRSTEVRRCAAVELTRLAREAPNIALLSAVTNLRWCLAQGWWMGDDDSATFSEAIRAIEHATSTLRNLPVPSGGASSVALLPVPVDTELELTEEYDLAADFSAKARRVRRATAFRRWLREKLGSYHGPSRLT